MADDIRIMVAAVMIAVGIMLIAAGPVSRLSLITTLPKLFKGRHGENRAVSFYQGRQARVQTRPVKDLLPDGEIFGRTPTENSCP